MEKTKLTRLFSTLPMRDACELHINLQAGRTDRETRALLQKAIRNSGVAQQQAHAR